MSTSSSVDALTGRTRPGAPRDGAGSDGAGSDGSRVTGDATDIAPAPRRRRATVAWSIAAVLTVLALVWLFVFSPVLGVRTVRVLGAGALAHDVQGAAAIPRGTPLARLDTDAVARRVERVPAVRSATVETSLPSTVTIRVVQRIAVGYLPVSGRAELVDALGVQFATRRTPPADLPRFSVVEGAGAHAAAAAVAAVTASLPASIRARLRSVQALDPSAITLVLPDTVVRWGTATRNAAKARVLAVLLGSGAGQIDVTDPLRPFTRQ